MNKQGFVYTKKSDTKKKNNFLINFFSKNFNFKSYPIKIKENQIIKWPLKNANGQPFLYGYYNEKNDKIEIYEESVMILLNWLGSFGNTFFLEKLLYNFNESNFRKKNQIKTNTDDSFGLNINSFLHNLQINSLLNSFKNFGHLESNSLIKKLYNKENCLVNTKLEKKDLNEFENTFQIIHKDYIQQFMDNEEYILSLDLEDAFFLKHVFGIISIQKNNFTNFTLNELWLKCIELNKLVNQCFITRYAAYFYFKSKGFIVKNGLKFGTDFVLYDNNPIMVHSTYSVLVFKNSNENSIDINYFQAFLRMTNSIVKVPIICFVTFPDQINLNELNSVKIISKLKIKCLLLQRWIPSIERIKKKK